MRVREQIGILGGAFDPVHNGHLQMARSARSAAGLNRVIFLPAAVSPYKSGESSAPVADRLKMLRLATAANSEWSVCEIELDRGGISYTIDSLRELRDQFGPEPEFHLVIGMDNFLDLAGWKEISEVIRRARFIVISRPGCDPEEISEENAFWVNKIRGAGRLIVVDLDLPISSSEIRQTIRSGGDPRPFLPANVVDYIDSCLLYRNEKPADN